MIFSPELRLLFASRLVSPRANAGGPIDRALARVHAEALDRLLADVEKRALLDEHTA